MESSSETWKTIIFGTKKNTLIFGLPGNPVSSYIGFMIWVWPILRKLMGSKETKSIKGILSEPFPLEKFKYRFLFGQAWMEKGQVKCKPSNKVGSHMVTSALAANCILSCNIGDGFLNPGEFIDIHLLPWKTIK